MGGGFYVEGGRKDEVEGGSQGRFLVVSVRDGERETEKENRAKA